MPRRPEAAPPVGMSSACHGISRVTTSIGPIADGFGNGSGQVWAYRTDEQTLQLIYESPDRDTLDFPDNVTTSPRGTIVLPAITSTWIDIRRPSGAVVAPAAQCADAVLSHR